MMSTDHCPAPLLRIQPQFSHYAQWARLAQRESLFYEALELSKAPMLDGNAAAACREWYKSSGRVNAIHGAFIDVNPASGDPAFRELSRRRCRESCTLAVELGAEQVVFHSSAFPFLRGGYLENWADLCAAFYMELAEEYRGLTLCIENSQDLDPEPLEALMKRTGDGVRVCLDIGHAHYSGTPLEAWFDVLGPSIACLHLSDNRGRFDDHQKRFYTRPCMCGSYSIKAVLPAMCGTDPSIDYHRLPVVHNGVEAMATFAGLDKVEDPQEVKRVREGLLLYCGLDTFAMVRVLQELFKIAEV